MELRTKNIYICASNYNILLSRFFKYCGKCFYLLDRELGVILHNHIDCGDIIVHGECLHRG